MHHPDAAPCRTIAVYTSPGGTVFFTVALQDRRSRLLIEHIDALPPGDSDFSTRWRLIKSGFSRAVPRSADPASGRREGERGIWQRRFCEHQIRDERDLDAHVAYIHWNPIKHRHAASMDEWPYSSWHRFKLALGQDASTWTPPTEDLDVGED